MTGTRSASTSSLRTTVAIGLILSASLVSCGPKSNPVGVVTDNYPASPYGFPTVNPVDSTIGFVHTPLLQISRTGGTYTYEYSDSGSAFWLVSWDGSRQRKVTSNFLIGTWSPDGRSLYYTGQGLNSVPWDGENLDLDASVELNEVPFGYDPKWNRAMTKIAMDGGQTILVWTAATSQLLEFAGAHWRQPDWSPDGSTLAFHGYADQMDALMVADTLGSNVKVLVTGLGYLDPPAWSPDGSRIAFAGRFGNGEMQLWTVKPDGTDLTQITTDGAQGRLSWSPSGAEIVYVHYHFSEKTCVGGVFTNGTIWRVNPTTKVRHQITFNSGLICP